MTTGFYTDLACLDHNMGEGHPESPARLRAILEKMDQVPYNALPRPVVNPAQKDDLKLVHDQAYIDHVFSSAPSKGIISLDPDTSMSPGSLQAALMAAGAVIGAVDAVIEGTLTNAFCAIRPPGHHAEPDKAMGFCLFNSVAIGAAHAIKKFGTSHGIKKVAVIDFDVHHGNGTEAMFKSRSDLMYISTHQMPLYPGTGDANFDGEYHNIVNIPLATGADGVAFRHAITQDALPALDRFQPDLVMISAGFDAHRDDPLAGLSFVDNDYAWASDQLLDFAKANCQSRVVSCLEGGYNTDVLADCVARHVDVLMQYSDQG